MSSYIEINNGGRITINDSYKNLLLLNKINSLSFTKENNTYTDNIYYADITEDDDKILLVSCSSSNYGFNIVRASSNIHLRVNCINGASISDINNYLTSYVFGYSDTSNNSGLSVYNSSGQVIFNSNNKYLRIIDCIDYNTNDSISRSYSHSVIALPPCFMDVFRFSSGRFPVITDEICYGAFMYFSNSSNISFSIFNPSGSTIPEHTGDHILVANKDNL